MARRRARAVRAVVEVLEGRQLLAADPFANENTVQTLPVVVEFDEGFLDLGEREVVMPIDRLQFGEDGSRVATTLSEDDLRSLEVWDD